MPTAGATVVSPECSLNIHYARIEIGLHETSSMLTLTRDRQMRSRSVADGSRKTWTRASSHPRILYGVFCFNLSTSSKPTPARPCVRLPCCVGGSVGPRYVGRILCTLDSPASPGAVGGALDGNEDGNAERSCSNWTLSRGGTGETILSDFNCLTCT